MTKTLKNEFRVLRRPAAIMALALLAGICGRASAEAAEPFSIGSERPTLAQPAFTPRGPAFVTGNLGSMETTTLPGSAAPGYLMNNNNGTSTLIAPGGLPQVVPTPR